MATSQYNKNPNTQPTGNLTMSGVPSSGSSGGGVPVGGQMTGQALANINALPKYSAPGSAGTAPVAKTGVEGRALYDSAAMSGKQPGAVDSSPPNINNFDPNTGKALTQGQSVINQATGQSITQGTPFQQAHQNIMASGAQAPQDQAQARTATTNAINQVPAETTSTLTPIVDTDKNFDNIFTQSDEFYSPVKQKQSLLDEYKSMESSLGINAMNAELLNSKRIIDGTEDDIRSEVQAVSGFATESQVIALANARNKTLMKNYNYLLESRDSAMTQLSTMMNLSIKDREMATQEFDRKMNFTFKMAEFKQKAVDNAKEGYNNVIKNLGYDGLYKSLAATGDSSAIGIAEKTLGLAPGGLKGLASQPNLERQKQKLELQKLGYEVIKAKNEANGEGSKILSVAEAEALGVPYGTTQAQARGISPGSGNGIPEKVQAKIQASPENKTINGVLPAIQSLVAFKNAVSKYGTTEQLSGSGKGELAGTYGNALSTWKTLATLGALSGADFALAENAVPSTGFFQRSSTMKGKLDASIKNAIDQAEIMTRRLQQNYPQATDNLQRQLDEAKVIAYPDKYKVGGDGQIYEITN